MTLPPTARRRALSAVAVTLLVAACGAPKAPELRAERDNPPPMGATWTMAQTSTGSFGSGPSEVTIRRGERTWQGRPVITQETRAGAMMLDPATGRRIGALAPDGSTAWSLDPPVGMQYPLEVGKTWTTASKLTVPATNRVLPFESTFRVEGVEDVKVPAGTFRTFRVTMNDTVGNSETYWMDPALGIPVKSELRRTDKSLSGPGTRTSALVSHTIRR
jgi:hypothetical protein